MTIPNNNPNTIFTRTTPDDGLLFGTEFSRLYANDNELQSQVNFLETQFDPQSQLSNTPNWSSPSISIAPSAKALDARAKSIFPLRRFAGWMADFWVSRASAADNAWISVCWSPELHLFVSVANTGTGNRVMTSPDGVT
ncbi:hypothetical protein ACQV5M_18635, partial [Leptospira sp. SA-E8]